MLNQGEFPKNGGYLILGVLIIRILLFRVLSWDPLFLEAPKKSRPSGALCKMPRSAAVDLCNESRPRCADFAVGLRLRPLGSCWGIFL